MRSIFGFTFLILPHVIARNPKRIGSVTNNVAVMDEKYVTLLALLGLVAVMFAAGFVVRVV